MKIIVISGKARAGKDTFAGFLKTVIENSGKKVLVTHYGDLVKYICKMFFSWNGVKDEAGRSILQHVGTEGVRTKKPDFWVDFIYQMLECFPDEWDYVLIPDARFPNEINYLKNKGLDVTHVRIFRPGDNGLTEEQKCHPSETSLDTYPYDVRVDNDGTLEDLAVKTSKFIF